MSLLSERMENFYIMTPEVVADSYGSTKVTSWSQSSAPFKGAITFDSSPKFEIADREDVISEYTLTTPRDVILSFKQVIKRASDGKVFIVTKDGDCRFTPQSSALNMRQVNIKEWELVL